MKRTLMVLVGCILFLSLIIAPAVSAEEPSKVEKPKLVAMEKIDAPQLTDKELEKIEGSIMVSVNLSVDIGPGMINFEFNGEILPEIPGMISIGLSL